MDGSLRKADRRDGLEDSGQAMRAIYRLTTRMCLSAGLTVGSAEDVAQDVWEWLLRTGRPVQTLPVPWLGSVVRNFVMRYRRRQSLLEKREGRRLDRVPEPEAPEPAAKIESRELLDRVLSVLPETERSLLLWIRKGYSLAEAARLVGIPRGSRAYFHGRLIECARRELHGRLVRPGPRRRPL